MIKKLRLFIGELLVSYFKKKNGVIVYYNWDEGQKKAAKLINGIRAEKTLCMKDNEAQQLYMLMRNTRKVEGDIAEVGCFMGASSKLICELKGNTPFHVFDTFEGLPEDSEFGDYHKGTYKGAYEEVSQYLSKYPNVFLYKGLFPSTGKPVEKRKFSFVNLDTDLYSSTVKSLEFFYPKMSKGGVILTHNYHDAVGVRKAYDEFFKKRPEPLIELSGTHCLIVKV